MKIGILTFHRPINYGAFLQAFALSNQIQRSFPKSEVEIIDYIAPKEKKKIYLNVLRTVKHYGIDAALKEVVKIRVFRKSLELLPLSKEKLSKVKFENFFSYIESNYDLLIIGSDAVFNWNQNGYPSVFIPQYKFNIPIVTYAASVHGLKYRDVEKNMLDESAFTFENMKIIGVRDKNTENFVKFCKETLQPVHCCDPTFLINFDSLYDVSHRSFEQIMKRYKINIEKQFIVLMLEDKDISKKIYQRYSDQYTIVSLFKKNKYSDAFLYDLTPIEWALVIKNSLLVVTNFFHGTLLALTQNIPVIVVDVSGYEMPYEGKLKDLMERRLNLAELYVKKNEWNLKESEMLDAADKCIQGNYKERIVNAIDKERQSFYEFETCLKTELGEYNNEDK